MSVLRWVSSSVIVGVVVGAAVAAGPVEAAPAIAYPEMQLINIHSRECLTTGGADSAVQQGCATGNAFRWLFVPLDLLGRFRIENADTRRCLGVAGGSVADEARVQEQACADDAVTSWQLKHAKGDGDFIADVHSGKCLTIEAGSTDAGAPAVQVPCQDIPARRWTVHLVGGLPITGVSIG